MLYLLLLTLAPYPDLSVDIDRGSHTLKAVSRCEEVWRVGEHVYGEGNLLCFRGVIDQPAVDLLMQRIPVEGGEVLFVVDSPGGSVEAGLLFAEEISDLEFSLVVAGKCLSSCANYFFVAAQTRYVTENSFIGWHGGPARSFEEIVSMISRSRKADSSMRTLEFASVQYELHEKLVKRQDALYRQKGISADVIYDRPLAFSCLPENDRTEVETMNSNERISVFWSPGSRTLAEHYDFTSIFYAKEKRTDSLIVLRGNNLLSEYIVDSECLRARFGENQE